MKMKNKIIILVYLIVNCVGLILFLIKGGQIEGKSGGWILESTKIIETNNSLIDNPPVEDAPHPQLIKSMVQLLSAIATLNIRTIRSAQGMAFCSIVLSGLNSLFFLGCLLRKRQIKSQ